MRKNREPVDWSKVDWSRDNMALSLELWAGQDTVRKMRPADRPSPRSVLLAHVAAIDWSRVNWAFSNAAIAGQLSIGETTVAKTRRALGKGRSRARK